MSGNVLQTGDKLHIITRQLFQTDIRRHFVGEVIKYSDLFQEITGYAFVFNTSLNEYKKRPDQRTRVFSLGQAGYIITRVPQEVELNSLRYKFIDNRLILTDNADFQMDINEFGTNS